jgi:hypothetical protein
MRHTTGTSQELGELVSGLAFRQGSAVGCVKEKKRRRFRLLQITPFSQTMFWGQMGWGLGRGSAPSTLGHKGHQRLVCPVDST